MMSNNTNERLEREARESLVAADLSAKMKQWRDQSPRPGGGNGGNSILRFLLLLLAVGGAAWWLWPEAADKTLPQVEPALEQPTTPAPQSTPTKLLEEPKQMPMAQKSTGNRYVALAQSNYRAPNFAADVRGNAPAAQDALNDARQALAEKRPADALDALQKVPGEYQSDANYLRAHALFGLKKYTQAAALFEQLSSSVRYGESAQWYGILASLPAMESNKAAIMSSLKKISDDQGHTFQQEAKRLAAAL